LTTRGKAQVVFAWLTKRADFEKVAHRLLLEAASLEAWAACWYEGQKKDLPRFLHTQLGKVAFRFARIRETKVRYVSMRRADGTRIETELPVVERWKPGEPTFTAVGRRVYEALREVLPKDWFTDELITQTLLDYQRIREGEHSARDGPIRLTAGSDIPGASVLNGKIGHQVRTAPNAPDCAIEIIRARGGDNASVDFDGKSRPARGRLPWRGRE
jgi:hypothetical protein